MELFGFDWDDKGVLIDEDGERLHCPYTDTVVSLHSFAVVPDHDTCEPLFINPTVYAFAMHKAKEYEKSDKDSKTTEGENQ